MSNSVQDGIWSAPTTWDSGPPTMADPGYVYHHVNLDVVGECDDFLLDAAASFAAASRKLHVYGAALIAGAITCNVGGEIIVDKDITINAGADLAAATITAGTGTYDCALTTNGVTLGAFMVTKDDVLYTVTLQDDLTAGPYRHTGASGFDANGHDVTFGAVSMEGGTSDFGSGNATCTTLAIATGTATGTGTITPSGDVSVTGGDLSGWGGTLALDSGAHGITWTPDTGGGVLSLGSNQALTLTGDIDGSGAVCLATAARIRGRHTISSLTVIGSLTAVGAIDGGGNSGVAFVAASGGGTGTDTGTGLS